MKFGIAIAALIYLVSCDRRAQLEAANLRSRELLAARISNNVQSRLSTTFDGDKTGFQVTSAVPASPQSQNQSKINTISNILTKQVVQTPVKKEEAIQPIIFTAIGKQSIPTISIAPSIQSKIIQSQTPYVSTPSKPQEILITSVTNSEPQSSSSGRQILYPAQGTNLIRGVNNQVLGQQNILDGNKNKIDGNQNIAIGNQNDIKGMRNDVTASNAIVKGHKNIVTESIDVSNLF